MKTQCPHCKAGFNVSADYIGKRGKCPKCNTPFVVEEYALRPVSIKETSPRQDTTQEARDGRSVSQHGAAEIKKILELKRQSYQPPNKGKRTRVGFSCLIQIAVDIFLSRRVVLPWLTAVFFAICFIRTALFPLI